MSDRNGIPGHATRVNVAELVDDQVLGATYDLLHALVAQVRIRGIGNDNPETASGIPARGLAAVFAGADKLGTLKAVAFVANELGLDLLKIDLGAVVSKWVGETEKNLEQAFRAAEAGGALLFFDEADALFGKRTEVKDSHDRYATLSTFLLRMVDRFPGVVIFATRDLAGLSDELLRSACFLAPLEDSGVAR